MTTRLSSICVAWHRPASLRRLPLRKRLAVLIIRESEQVALSEFSHCGFGLPQTLVELERKNRQLRSALRLRQKPFSLDLIGSPRMAISGIAGSLKLFGEQIEVIPKFSNEKSW